MADVALAKPYLKWLSKYRLFCLWYILDLRNNCRNRVHPKKLLPQQYGHGPGVSVGAGRAQTPQLSAPLCLRAVFMHNITLLFAMLAVCLPSKQISKTLFLRETKEALLEKKRPRCMYYVNISTRTRDFEMHFNGPWMLSVEMLFFQKQFSKFIIIWWWPRKEWDQKLVQALVQAMNLL